MEGTQGDPAPATPSGRGWWPRGWGCRLAGVLAMGAAGPPSAGPAHGLQEPVPRLSVEASEHDFGTALEGDMLLHTFRLVSDGTADLTIRRVVPTCGCTLARLEVVQADGSKEAYALGDPLPPGTALDLVVELDTSDTRLQASSQIHLACNDPRGSVALGIHARVEPYFQITPAALDFGELLVQGQAERSFTVVGRKPEPFQLVLEEIPRPDGLSVTLAPKEPDALGRAHTWEGKVVIGPGAREGNIGYPVTLRSDHFVAGARPDEAGAMATYGARVITRARIVGVIDLDPRLLSFGLVRPGQVVRRTLTLRTFDPAYTFPADLEPRLVGAGDEAFPHASSFSSKIERAADGRSAVVTLTLEGLPDGFEGSFLGGLVFEIGHPQRPTVKVAFSGLCRP